jgi:hypothetical protein
MNKAFMALTLLLVTNITLTACSATSSVAKKDEPAVKETTTASEAAMMELYEINAEGRLNIFYDRALYNEFLSLGETAYRLTRIGAGPNGETIVFGLTKNDKKHPDNVAAIQLFDGKIKAPANFYAEMRKHGRIYVFSSYEDMQPVRDFGHPNFFYTEIGTGPKGETVVYVLNSKNKKKRPDAMIEQFKKMQQTAM